MRVGSVDCLGDPVLARTIMRLLPLPYGTQEDQGKAKSGEGERDPKADLNSNEPGDMS